MITVWGRTNSPNVVKVLWMLDELGLEYERVDAGGPFGLTNEPDYRAMNPNGRIPTLRDGEMVVWESNAIVRFLAARYGGNGLWSNDAGERSQHDRWMDWASLAFYQPVLALHRAAKLEDSAERQDAIAKAKAALAEPINVLSNVLGSCEYIAGRQFGVGDIALGPHVHRLINASQLVEPSKAVSAYHGRLAARPAFSRHANGIL